MKYSLFYFLKFFVGVALQMNFKRVYVDGLENFPKNKPVLLCSNHPNSFLDGVIYEYFNWRKVYTLVRGDVFRKPLANKFLRSILLLPIFRARDADPSVAKSGNQKTTDEVNELFTRNQAVLIFSEADAFPEKKVRRLKRGSMQLAVDTFVKSNYTLDLYIVPCGLNYERFFQNRFNIHFSYSAPISLQAHKEAIQADPVLWVNTQTDLLQNLIEDQVVKSDGEDQEILDFVQEMQLNDVVMLPKFYQKNKNLQAIVQQVEAVKQNQALREKLVAYKKMLQTHKLSDRVIAGNGMDMFSWIVALFTAGVSLPYFLFSKIVQMYSRNFVLKKIKNIVFRDSIRLGLSMAMMLVFTMVMVVVFMVKWSWFWGILFTAAAMYGGLMWYRIVDDFSYIHQMFGRLKLKDEVWKTLQEKRIECKEALEGVWK